MAQSTKVLLVEDNRIEAHQTQHWLASDKSGGFSVQWVERLDLAVKRLSQSGIDIVLLDLNLPDSRGIETFLALHRMAPGVPIIVLTGEDDESLGVAAVEKGAQDYLVKHQVDGSKLARLVRFALVRQRARVAPVDEATHGTPGRVIGFMGAKGGVGTTTVALHVALTLAKQRKSVILAELRPSFGTLAYRLHQDPIKGLRGLLDQFPEHLAGTDLDKLLCHGPTHLRILFGPKCTDVFKEIPPGQATSVVEGLLRMAEFVILDLPNQPSEATQAAALACHFICVVTEREPGSVASAKAALNQLKSWGLDDNRVSTVIVNRTDYSSQVNSSEIEALLGCQISGVVPPGSSATLQALVSGTAGASSNAEQISDSFLEIARRLSADSLVGVKF